MKVTPQRSKRAHGQACKSIAIVTFTFVVAREPSSYRVKANWCQILLESESTRVTVCKQIAFANVDRTVNIL